MKERILLLLFIVALNANAQFSQNFDASTAIPSGWSVINSSGTAPWTVSNVGTTVAHSGSNVAKVAALTPTSMLVTPQIYVQTGVNDRLAFWAKSTELSSLPRYYSLKISTTSTTPASFVDLGLSGVFNIWSQKIIDLSAYAGQSVYLGFEGRFNDMPQLYLDDVSNSRLIPTLHSDCRGIYNLTTNASSLLNGLDPSQHTITYFTSDSGANFNNFPIIDPTNLILGSNNPVIIYARITNNSTGAFTINYFNLVSDKVSEIQFTCNAQACSVQTNNNSVSHTFQWYDSSGSINGVTGDYLNFFMFGSSSDFRVVYNNVLGCSLTSAYVQRILAFSDFYSVNFTNGSAATTASVLNNDFIPNNGINATVNSISPLPAGITINSDGTITVAVGTPPGTYSLSYEVETSTMTSGTSYTEPSTHVSYNAQGYVSLTIPPYNDGIMLNAFLDTNGNNIQDVGENNFADGTFTYQMNSAPIHHVNSSIGKYYLQESNPLNSYNLSYAIDNTNFCGSQYTIATSSYNNISVPMGSGVVKYNFPITIIPCTDLSVGIVPYGGTVPRPTLNYLNRVYYKSMSNQNISGTLTFLKDSQTTIVSVEPSATITNNGFTYGFINLMPNEERYIDVWMTPETTVIGESLINSVSITPTDGNPINNTSSLTQIVANSYDPNDKTEHHGPDILFSSFTADDYLTYTIQFENTGTANAINIRLNDVLDAGLDETSVKMLSASHPYVLDRVGSALNWHFREINLPPSVADSSIGKGYIVFQVKPKPGYAVGDIIPNSALIYFDSNPPISTNIFETHFLNVLGTDESENINYAVYPNPATDKITVALKNTDAIAAISIVDLSGKIIFKKIENKNNSSIVVDISSLASGVYFIEIVTKANYKTTKKLVIQ